MLLEPAFMNNSFLLAIKSLEDSLITVLLKKKLHPKKNFSAGIQIRDSSDFVSPIALTTWPPQNIEFRKMHEFYDHFVYNIQAAILMP